MSTNKELNYREALHQSMHSALEKNSNAILMGQGVTDPTRAFGTTKGLVEKYGKERIIDTPIAEEAMTGMALGAALNGLYPIQIHIRVDFLVLALNQIINLIAKYKYMYAGMFEVPMLIRAVIGRSWGQGPQHSQSLQAILAHVPGLTVLMPSTSNSILQSYSYAVEQFRGPVIGIEHRWLYDMSFYSKPVSEGNPFGAKILAKGDDFTIVTTSYMAHEALDAVQWVSQKKSISCDIIDLHNISHVDHELVFESVKKTGRLIIADTSWLAYGVCAEVCRGIMERNPSVLKHPVTQIGLKNTPTPTSHALERYYYPDMGTIANAIYSALYGRNHGLELPTEEFKKAQRVKFKGPF